ncbi:hypothetical protein AB833_30980 [Chromatiales bacterium (ex Bugula neritina AB1)]|nr:hypothetical protein AB833_30980 [Chromatiales bacterium (ex Bugula neritina AB1)]
MALAALLLLASQSQATGFREISVEDSGYRDLTVGLWYPSEQAAPTEPNTRFGHAMAVDAELPDTKMPLILISHGYSGWYAGHANTAQALADAGYIVAAPSHTGNTWSDMSSPVERWTLDRPRHMSRVIDTLTQDPTYSLHVDADRIGVYGFSAGGYTALNLIGGWPDLNHAKTHCDNTPDEFACYEGLVDQMVNANMQQLPADSWGSDPRIKAASIAAPGLGFAYTEQTLAEVAAPVQLWSGALDTSVPTKTNAASIAALLPDQPEKNWVANAGHFAFLVMPCREAFKREDPEEYEIVCVDKPGFDRYAFHAEMNASMVRFFDRELKGKAE